MLLRLKSSCYFGTETASWLLHNFANMKSQVNSLIYSVFLLYLKYMDHLVSFYYLSFMCSGRMGDFWFGLEVFFAV